MLKNRKIKILMLIMTDLFLIAISYLFGLIFRFYSPVTDMIGIFSMYKKFTLYIIIAIIIYILLLCFFRQYKNIWRLARLTEFINASIASIIGILINLIIVTFTQNNNLVIPTILSGIFFIGFYITSRVLWKIINKNNSNEKVNEDINRILIVGAGDAGGVVLSEFEKNPQFGKKVIAFIDDDKQKQGTLIGGIKVIGNRNDISKVVQENKIDEIVIAMSKVEKIELKNIIEKCRESKAKVKIMPGISEMIDGKFSIKSIRDINVEDLLGRETIRLDYEEISDYLTNKVVLVTGGGGSIGSELCRQIAKFNPKKLIIFDIYENNAYDIQNELKRNYFKLDLDTIIGSVRDRKRLREIYSEYKPNVVFHAAAHKHVPLMEDSPQEAIKNNVVGTFNVAEMANNYNVEKFVLISTDKAVNPTNIMGATKRICEMIIQSLNKESDTDYVAVRFGNVLGSNGSVVPLFKKQIDAGGPITLTHKDIRRYFMTIPEATQLVIQAAAYANGGEIFVLDMGKPVKIYDLAENMIRLSGFEPNKDIKIEVTGLRPGEKLYEELFMDEEGLKQTKHNKIFIGKPGKHKLDDIVYEINELVKVSELNNKELIKKKIKEIVPTYRELDELNKRVKVEIAITESEE